MARQEQDREDLLREATALVERVELQCDGFPDPVVLGFRRSGEGSIFFGADPVYQFNSRLELRRAYCAGQLLKADRGRLAALERHRTQAEVQLLRTDLTESQTVNFILRLHACLDQLRRALSERRYTVVGQVPDNIDVVARAATWLQSLPTEIVIAAAPHVR